MIRKKVLWFNKWLKLKFVPSGYLNLFDKLCTQLCNATGSDTGHKYTNLQSTFQTPLPFICVALTLLKQHSTELSQMNTKAKQNRISSCVSAGSF